HDDHDPPSRMNLNEKAIAVCPGTYDPVTNGHLDVIRRTANLYDEVVVAVVNRSVRKSGALFDISERLAFIEHAIAGFENVRPEAFSTRVVEVEGSARARASTKVLRDLPACEYD